MDLSSADETRPVPQPITLTEVPAHPILIAENQQLTFREFVKPADFVPPADPHIASFDVGKLPFPLLIRPWQAGDRFRPLGLNGQKLVSDLLADLRVPRLEREQVWVLLTGDQIAWVIGKRPGHRCCITPQTRHVLQVRLTEK